MSKPIVLTIAGADPSGGAGISADIEAIAAHGCICAPVISAITVQDTCSVRSIHPIEPRLVLAQMDAALNDLPISAIKLGLLADSSLMAELGTRLAELTAVPIVIDPVLRAGSGDALTQAGCTQALFRHVIPHAAVVTPNRAELRALAQTDDIDTAAHRLLAQGCGAVLVTGADEPEAGQVGHALYRSDRPALRWEWPLLPHSYHGSGCTLASALAAQLAYGAPLETAALEAQRYTWNALAQGLRLGNCQLHPNRLWNLSRP